MSDSNPQGTPISFFDSHKPVMVDGAYNIEVTQNIQITGKTEPVQPTTQNLPFHVSGPRFTLTPADVHSVYPPTGGKGDYRADLPKVILNRSTLPWERFADAGTSNGSASWLFLLLVHQKEIDGGLVKETHNAAITGLSSTFNRPITIDEQKRLPKAINYLTIDSTIQAYIPSTTSELAYYSYARIKESTAEQAILIGNRLPEPGESSTVYLVSLEHAYSEGNLNTSVLNYPYLYKWDFHAFKDQLYSLTSSILEKVQSVHSGITQDLQSIFQNVYTQTSTFQKALTGLGVTDSGDLDALTTASKLPGSTFHELLSHLRNGFGAFSIDAQSTGITSTGAIQLPYMHTTENAQGVVQGDQLQYYYRGPLVSGPLNLGGLENLLPGPNCTSLPQHSDELRIQLSGNQTIDATYAAAFEIGKLTAINDSSFATAYYQWKNEAATVIRANNIDGTNNHSIPSIPDVVSDKITQWKSLQGIPYRYLIPDPTLLPNESIRFFTLDRYWLYSFLAGVFSIGHTVSTVVPTTKANQDFRMQSLIDTLSGFYYDPSPVPMGVLVNSLAVSGWPNFQVTVTYTDNTSETVIHEPDNNLDTNICMLLFKSAYNQLDFHLHPGKVPAGFLYEGPPIPSKNNTQSLGTYEKQNFEGTDTWLTPTEAGGTYITDERVISATEIAKALQTYLSGNPSTTPATVANFALHMLEPKAEVQFTIKQPLA